MTGPDPALLPEWLAAAVRSAPERLALVFGDERWSFTGLQGAVAAAAGIIATLGERDGRVGILSANRPGFVFAVHAARRLGVSIVPLNWRQTSEELAWQLRDAGVGVLIVDDERAQVAVVAAAGLDIAVVPIEALEQPGSGVSSDLSARSIDLNDEAAVLYTSGTSGRAKGARLTYGNLWYSAIASTLHLEHRRDDVWLAVLPFFHIGGLSILMRGVIGATPVVLHDRFDPERINAALDDGVTLLSAVPTMMRQMIEFRGPAAWPGSLRCVLLGGSAAAAELVAECLRLGIRIAPTYGLTEAASQVTTLLPGEAAARSSSAGRPLPLTQLRITVHDRLAEPGETGEIELRGPTLFAGYVHDGGSERGNDSPWFRTGDAGYLDEEGYLYVVDRRDDLIVSGGENVYPAEIERVLLAYPAVRDAAVVGLPDATWDARPVAIVVWDGDPASAAGELLAHCQARLAAFKIPGDILVRDELPRSPSGKLLRRELRDALRLDDSDPG